MVIENQNGYRNTTGKRNFIKVWLIIAAVVLLLWAIGLIVVVKALEEYESVQPSYAAESVFIKYFRDADADTMVQYDGDMFEKPVDAEKAAEYLKSLLGGERSYKSVFSTDENIRVYSVKSGENTIGTFTLKQGDRKTSMTKQRFWELSNISMNISGLYGVSVFAPKLAVVTVNGVRLTEENIQGEEVILSPEVYFPEDDDEFLVMVNYVAEGLYSSPDVHVVSAGPDSVEYVLTFDEENLAYSAEYGYRKAMIEAYNASVTRSKELAEQAEQRRAAEAERLRLEEEEKRRQEEEERLRISDSIKALYGDFMIRAGEQYNKFIYYVTTNKVRDNTKVYFKSGTRMYRYVANGPSDGGYYNWADYYVDSIDYSGENTYDYEWVNEKHTQFKCHLEMTVDMSGHNMATYVKSDLHEHFDMIFYVDVSGASPLIYEMLTPESDAAAQ